MQTACLHQALTDCSFGVVAAVGVDAVGVDAVDVDAVDVGVDVDADVADSCFVEYSATHAHLHHLADSIGNVNVD